MLQSSVPHTQYRQGHRQDLMRMQHAHTHIQFIFLEGYPERPHRQCVGLVARWSRVRVPVAAASLMIYVRHLHRAIRGAQGVLPCVGWYVTASQLDLPSVTPLSVADCGRLQLGAPHWATSVTSLQVLDNWRPFCCSRFSPGRLLAIEVFTFSLHVNYARHYLIKSPTVHIKKKKLKQLRHVTYLRMYISFWCTRRGELNHL